MRVKSLFDIEMSVMVDKFVQGNELHVVSST